MTEGHSRRSGGAGWRTVAAAVRRWGPLAVVALGIVLVYATGLHEKLTLDKVIREHETLKAAVRDDYLLVFLAFVLAYVVTVALSVPGASLLTIVGGYLFGWFVGCAVTVAAATTGAVVIFLIARSALGEPLRNRAGPFMARLAEGFREDALSYLLFLRLVPLFPFWLVNIAPAVFEVRLRVYVLATAVGIIPGTFAYTLVGDGLGSLIAAQEEADPGCAARGTCEIDLGALLTPKVIAAFVALGVVSLIPVALKRIRRARQRPADGGVS